MTGRLEVKAGRICFMGTVISKMTAWEVARLGVGRKFQIPTVFSSLSVGENLLIAQWANRIRPLELFSYKPLRWSTSGLQRMLHRFPSLATSVEELASTLAQGNRQVLEFAMVAISEPRLMLLDEPCAGLSADETRQMMDAITCTVSELQASSVVIEHDMSALEKIADHVVVLHQGKRLATGSLSYIRSSDEVRQVYAGGRK
ncbi:ATP-binding cassette domain-containing protein [Caballeronia sp. J97]|uniref:ATP-binding cassette domain-containing protein n=1 Tax=Caballeronia sp. J97 TaxID=2805429 RepID=UPI002AB201BE|nr:ATP-binding cassette domain-containing protein [Caballeronia sp. J97]